MYHSEMMELFFGSGASYRAYFEYSGSRVQPMYDNFHLSSGDALHCPILRLEPTLGKLLPDDLAILLVDYNSDVSAGGIPFESG